MQYNTQKKPLIIPEYGRIVQNMIQHLKTIEDKKERNLFAQATVEVMSNLNPNYGDADEYEHKLWDQLYIMADYQLDIDAPYPMPNKEELYKKPKKLKYHSELRRNRYYGRILQDMIDEVKNWEEGEKKQAMALQIADQMKKSFINWNKENVEDQKILDDLNKLSDGKIKLEDPSLLIQNYKRTVESSSNNNKRKRKKKGKK